MQKLVFKSIEPPTYLKSLNPLFFLGYFGPWVYDQILAMYIILMLSCLSFLLCLFIISTR